MFSRRRALILGFAAVGLAGCSSSSTTINVNNNDAGTQTGGSNSTGGKSGTSGTDGIGGLNSTGGMTSSRLIASAIAAGDSHTCAVLSGGAVQCWGDNTWGQLGNGKTGNGATMISTGPVAVSGLTNASTIAAGRQHTCAVLNGGAIQCWGASYGAGALGDGTTADSALPVTVLGVTNAIAVSPGYDHTCAVLNGGTVQCWGWNDQGQLGNGTTTNSNLPIAVSGITNATAIVANWKYTCALLGNGKVQCWGRNTDSELGDGTTTASIVPVTVLNITSAMSIGKASEGDHICSLLSGGTVQCWGANAYGQLGNGSTVNSSVPVAVSGVASATSIAEGGWHTCALVSVGTIQCWGYNGDGELGNGTTTNNAVPVTVSGITNASAIAASKHTCAVLSGGTVQCWGGNGHGEIGNGSTTNSNVPVTVGGF